MIIIVTSRYSVDEIFKRCHEKFLQYVFKYFCLYFIQKNNFITSRK